MMFNPFTPHGRLRRRSYLPTLLAMNIAMAFVRRVPTHRADTRLAVVLLTILVLWTFYCAWARRLHDAGRTGALAAVNVAVLCVAGTILETQSGRTLGLVAVTCLSANILIGGYLLLAPPTHGPNRYGPDPRSAPPVPSRLDAEPGL